MTSNISNIVSGSHAHTKTIHGTHMISDAVTHTLEKHTHTKTHTNTHTHTHKHTHTHVILTYISSDHSNSTDVIPQRVVSVPRLLPHHSKSGDSSALSREAVSIKET